MEKVIWLTWEIPRWVLLFERRTHGRRLGLGSGPRGRAFTHGLLLLTVPLLFPPPFVLRVINPFLDFLHELLL